ncbi:MAG: anti-sigma factor family protein, partial [Alphaproteobacteria bacterium]
MSPHACAAVEERDLLAYVDGRLAPERRRAVERALDERPGERARLDDYARQNEALRRHLGGVAAEPVPPRLRAVLDGSPA